MADPRANSLSATKRRIVECAISVFNAETFGNVTTARLADTLGMSEGNLWYHYKTKADLLAAIQGLFISEWRSAFSTTPTQGAQIGDYLHFCAIWIGFFKRYHFLFRDRAEYGVHSPALVATLPEIYDHIADHLRTFYLGMIDAKLLQVPNSDLDDLVWDVILKTRFFVEFQSEAQRSDCVSLSAIAQQHLSLLKPYASAESFRDIRNGILELTSP